MTLHEVAGINFGVPCKTRVWLSVSARKDISKFRKRGDPDGRFWKHIQRCAINGFALYETGDSPIVKSEWGGVFRIGFDYSLFRLIGFYENDHAKSDFIVIDTFTKSGTKLSVAERQRINVVGTVKEGHLWRKAQDGNYPRLA